jgi:hypothetical protein
VTPEQRVVFAALADVLLPACDGMPAASEVDVAGRWLDRVLRVRPDLAPELERVLAAATDGSPEHALARLRAEDPVGLEALVAVVTGAYYMSPKVRRPLGYPGQRPRPAYPDEADWDLRDGLLDPVVERGPIYRQTLS